MGLTWGVHTGLQNTTVDELKDLWHRIENHGFDWISIWDHFYAADLGGTHSLEAIAAHTALAMRDRTGPGRLPRVLRRLPPPGRPGQRHHHHRPPLRRPGRAGPGRGLGGRRVRGLRHPLPRPGERLDILEEAVQVHPRTAARTTALTSPANTSPSPTPQQPQTRLAAPRVWVGGDGEKRTLPSPPGARRVERPPFVAPETFAHKREVLAEHCAAIDRDPAEIRCAVNVGAARDLAGLRAQFGAMTDYARPGCLVGSARGDGRPDRRLRRRRG